MNTEELERSLRSEFENYMKGAAAELKQETAEFQQQIAAEFDKQRQAIDEAFAKFSARFDSDKYLDEAFASSVSEHLKLARDEGAKLTATAFAEAEKLEESTAQQPASYDSIRDAVDDISSKDSQSAILKALVTRAAEFAPRGAFFVIKNEHLAGWRVFGDADEHAENAVREIHFPVQADSILGHAVRKVETVEAAGGSHAADATFLEALGFGHPDRMYAIPLVARGRAVAVLYADYGRDGSQLSREALETLVKVAGLTVELNAAIGSQPAPEPVQETQATPAPEPETEETHSFEPEQPSQAFEEPAQTFEQPASFEQPSATDFSFSESVSYEGGFPTADTPEDVSQDTGQPFETQDSSDAVPAVEWQQSDEPSFETTNGAADHTNFEGATSFDTSEFQQTDTASTVGEAASVEAEDEPSFTYTPEFQESTTEATEQVDTEPSFDSAFDTEPAAQFEGSSEFDAAPQFEPASAPSFGSFEPAPAPEKSVVPIAGSRLSDRPVDLPIEVPEEERRSHNDARRFARLLVSEIKLYNEKKVLEGRQSRDLYQRLQEAIDRSREMYDKRVQPPVAAKFDYFHYELVNALAEGEPGRLGSGYPGPTI